MWNGQNIWEMTYWLIMSNFLKMLENDLNEMAKIFGKWLRCMGHGLSILETA